MSIRVLSLNVWGLPFGLARAVPERMARIGAELPVLEPDLVAFQEVWTHAARRALIEAGQRSGHVHGWYVQRRLMNGGLLVLSRWPISEARFTRFSLGGWPHRIDHADYYGGKGLAALRIETPDGAIALLVTHLQADYVPSEHADPYLPTRVAQVVELATIARASRLPTIAVGDFNADEDGLAHRLLRVLTGWSDVAIALDRRLATCLAPHPYRSARARPRRIDHVFVSNGPGPRPVPLALRRVLDAELEIDGALGAYSDHAGLLAELALREEASAEGADPARADTPASAAAPAPSDEAEVVLARAAETLRAGRETAAAQQRNARIVSAAGALTVGGGLGAARRPGRDRRAFLHAAGLAAVGAGLGLGLSAGWLAERFGRAELRAFVAAEAELEALR